MPPAPKPTVTPAPSFRPATLIDDFSAFDSSIWLSQCSGCVYADGVLKVDGISQLQRTISSVDALSRIVATLVKNDIRDDHGIVVSRHPTYTWSWSYTNGAVKFVWEGDTKAIIGQTETTDVSCSAERTYNLEINVYGYSVAFADDVCGTLTLSETLGAESSLYVYVGASNGRNPTANGAEWDAVAIWGDGLSGRSDDGEMTFVPTSAPTTYEPAAVTDLFNGFESSLWLAPCSGCSYNSGALYVTGNKQAIRSRGSFSALSKLSGSLGKGETYDNHALAVSTSPAYSFDWQPTTGSVLFGWLGSTKQIVGQFQSTSSVCSFTTTYVIHARFSSTAVTFTDDKCGSLTLSDAIGSEPSLYVYLGADNDAPNEALWLDWSAWGTPAWDYSTPGPSTSPTMLPQPLPTTLPSAVPAPKPSSLPSSIPRPSPSLQPTPIPVPVPTVLPKPAPSPQPTATFAPTEGTPHPTVLPSETPSPKPTPRPTQAPTLNPSLLPSAAPSLMPLPAPSLLPLPAPTGAPTPVPSFPRHEVAAFCIYSSLIFILI